MAIQVDRITYHIEVDITEIYTRLDRYIYLLDKDSNEVARVLPCEGRDLSILREEDDNERGC